MSARYARGKRARGLCDICGLEYRLSRLKPLVRKDNNTGMLACPDCWVPDHPQLDLGKTIVYDPQALRNPRPDSAELADVRAMRVPVGPFIAFALLGDVMGGVAASGGKLLLEDTNRFLLQDNEFILLEDQL